MITAIIAFIVAGVLVIGSAMIHDPDGANVMFFLGVIAGFTGFLLWIL